MIDPLLDMIEGRHLYGTTIIPVHRLPFIPPTITQYPTRVHAWADRLAVAILGAPVCCPRCTYGIPELCDLHHPSTALTMRATGYPADTAASGTDAARTTQPDDSRASATIPADAHLTR